MAITGWANNAGLTYSHAAWNTIKNAITISAWIKISSVSAAQVILSKWYLESRGYLFYVSADAGYVGRLMFGLSSNGSTQYKTYSDSVLPTNKRAHVVGRYNRTNLVCFVDGVKQSSPTAYTGNIYASNVPLVIGRYYGSAHPLTGPGFDLRLYNRALSDDECVGLYESYGRDAITSGLVLRTCIADGCVGLGSLSGKKVYDHSANANHITATGALTSIADPFAPFPTEDA